jgi:hypothetical protein
VICSILVINVMEKSGKGTEYWRLCFYLNIYLKITYWDENSCNIKLTFEVNNSVTLVYWQCTIMILTGLLRGPPEVLVGKDLKEVRESAAQICGEWHWRGGTSKTRAWHGSVSVCCVRGTAEALQVEWSVLEANQCKLRLLDNEGNEV